MMLPFEDPTPDPVLNKLKNTPSAPSGIIEPLNNLLGMTTFAVLALAILAFLVTCALLIMSSLGRGGDGLEHLVRRVVKIFAGCVGATSVLAFFTTVTGGF